MQKVVTHNGGFHADDVFAVATLQLHFGVENVEVVRTRDEGTIASGDIVVDVGGVYNPLLQRFDHHQNGAPVRENGIPYAAFGLVWKHYGEQVAGSLEAAEVIERRLVIPIDAGDNGVSLYEQKQPDFSPATVQDMIGLMKPVWGSEEDIDERFLAACTLVREILVRAKEHAVADLQEATLAQNIYNSAVDKKVLVSSEGISPSFYTDKEEVLFVVCPDDNGNWVAAAVRKERGSFETKVSFPSEWGGLRDADLVAVSGVPDAIFCHKAGFLFVAKSKEGVLAAVNKTLNQK